MVLRKLVLPIAAGIVLLSCTLSQKSSHKTSDSKLTPPTSSVKKDTAKKGLKPYSEIITSKAITEVGLFKVHKVDERYYFEIPDSLLNKDILVVNRIGKAPPTLAFGGDQIGEAVIQFDKGPNYKMLLKRMSFLMRSSDREKDGMEQAVENSNYQPINAAFDIKAIAPDSTSSVIDMTDYINGDNEILFFSRIVNGNVVEKMQGYQADKSFINNIRAFPKNIEVRTTKTYLRGTTLVSFELNSSIILLPDYAMKIRYLDERVGYFAQGHYNFDANRPVDVKWMINRWKLEPRPEDIEKYKRGELVDPVKPIVYYIDPATPKKWVPFLIQGVNDWQKAFKKAGFKNAIYAREAPGKQEDSTWSLEDARHSVIVYKAATIPNASGPYISDPRTGEILETHINWYHNVMQILQDWYFIQASPNDSNARKMQFDDSLMGQLIRYVCAHEVGHTLGLRHNFYASSTVPTDSLRSKKYLDENGICPSIMDYARFNYVAQPEDKLQPADLIARIGIYDEWAIEWGYKWFPQFKTGKDEIEFMNNWVSTRVEKDKRLWFGVEPHPYYNQDPKRQMEDLGDNPAKSSYYGIQNLKRIVPHLEGWTKISSDKEYDDLKRLYRQVWDQYFRYVNHVAIMIGGVSWIEKYSTPGTGVITYPDAKQQRAAVRLLVDEVFTTPKWLMNNRLYKIASTDPSWNEFQGQMYMVNAIQRLILDRIASNNVASNLLVQQTSSADDYYSVDQLFTDIEAGIWKELKVRSSIDIYRRNLQKAYVEKLIEMMAGFFATRNGWDKKLYPAVTITDVYPIVKSHLRDLERLAKNALPAYKDKISRLHLIEISERIENALHDYPNSWMLMENSRQPTKSNGLNMTNIDSSDKRSDEFLYSPRNSNCWDNVSPFN